MHVAARARLVLARRPWIYWAVVAVLAGLAAATVQGQISSVAAERDRWGATRTVLVATGHHEAGDPVVAAPMTLPVAALPDTALDELPDGAVVRQRVAAGEVLTRTRRHRSRRAGNAGRAGDRGGCVVGPARTRRRRRPLRAGECRRSRRRRRCDGSPASSTTWSSSRSANVTDRAWPPPPSRASPACSISRDQFDRVRTVEPADEVRRRQRAPVNTRISTTTPRTIR